MERTIKVEHATWFLDHLAVQLFSLISDDFNWLYNILFNSFYTTHLIVFTLLNKILYHDQTKQIVGRNI